MCQLPERAYAEPVLDRALASADVTSKNGCSQLRVAFNLRIRYQSHFPSNFGDEIRINVRPLDTAAAATEILTRREALRAPESKGALIRTIDLVSDSAAGPELVIRFKKPVYFDVGQARDFESIMIAISGSKPSGTCKPDVISGSKGLNWAAKETTGRQQADIASIEPEPLPDHATRALTGADKRSADAWMDEARAALKKNNPAAAVKLLTKILRLPENGKSAEALEYLGLAYQRANQPLAAQAAYERYLQQHPGGDDAERVRQRLSGVVTARAEPGASAEPETKATRRSSGGFRTNPDGNSAWSVSGSASEFYIRDDSFNVLHDPSLPRNFNADKDDHRVHQNQLLTSFDVAAAWSNESVRSKFRFSGTEEHDVSGIDDDVIGVAALYYELAVKDWNMETRLGRQTRNTGGVLGRFDGGLLSWQAAPWVRFNAVGGSPVSRRFDEPLKDDKYLYGGSIDFFPPMAGFDFSIYAIEQRDQEWIDRQAVGTELRYLSQDLTAFGTLDYDVHFNQLNLALLSGTWTMPDKSTLSGAAELRRSPFISTWTALQGQPFLTLYDLLRAHTLEEVEQLAVDRSAEYRSASLGYSRLLTGNLQLNLDVTASETSGTPASGGVPESFATGTELYYSAQVIANSLFEAGDSYIAGVRLADRDDSNLYALDLSARYPLTDAWRVSPRVRFGYREGDEIDLVEYSVLPSVLVNYHWTRDLAFELEAGVNWTETTTGHVTVEDTELFFTFGVRYDFYADNQSACASRAASCQ